FESAEVERFSGDRLYDAFTKAGIHLGSAFRTLDKVVRGGEWLRAEVRLSPLAASSDGTVRSEWARLLDGALQAAGLLLESGAVVALPYCAEQISRLGAVGSTEASVLARRTRVGGSERADVWILCEGRPVGFIEGLGLGRLS